MSLAGQLAARSSLVARTRRTRARARVTFITLITLITLTGAGGAVDRAPLSAPRPPSLLTSRELGVHGGGGLGKSVLAQLVCSHPRVRYRFPDGLLWLAIGQTPRVVETQQRLRRHLRNYASEVRRPWAAWWHVGPPYGG